MLKISRSSDLTIKAFKNDNNEFVDVTNRANKTIKIFYKII